MEKYEDRSGKPRVLACLLLLLLTLYAALCMDLSTHPSVGGWVPQNPNEPNLLAVARFAELSTAQPGGPRYRVLRVLSAWSQLVNGFNYRVIYVRALTCGARYNRRMCDQIGLQHTQQCMGVVHVEVDTGRKNLLGHSCDEHENGKSPVPRPPSLNRRI
ncbi:mialostatin-like [Rhipicephalus microplus]|uniref:mialostatin-like n=1 Tax=Rhipicephalus microplus TaxID=6941 RepID=UPI003F6B43D9